MTSSSTMQISQQFMGTTGNPAQVWSNMLVPATAKITVNITGGTLQGTTRTGIEKKQCLDTQSGYRLH